MKKVDQKVLVCALLLGAVLAGAILLPGCAKKVVKPVGGPRIEIPRDPEPAERPERTERLPWYRRSALEAELQPVFFEFDSVALTAKTREILAQNAEAIKGAELPASSLILVIGRCDERGTMGYNLALGEHRAQSIVKYYKDLGIPADSLETLSYGEEKPTCTERSEECWADNRRGDTELR